MRLFIFIFIFIISFAPSIAGDKYITRTGHIEFISHTPIIDIQGVNDQVASVLNIKTGEMVFAVLMKSFKFKQALAEEHFNENYVDSDTYPRSKFKGKILNISNIDLTQDGMYDVTVEGDLTIKGRTNKIKSKGTMIVKDGMVTAKSGFTIAIADYGIEVPAIVKDKVAKQIPIDIEMVYKPYKK